MLSLSLSLSIYLTFSTLNSCILVNPLPPPPLPSFTAFLRQLKKLNLNSKVTYCFLSLNWDEIEYIIEKQIQLDKACCLRNWEFNSLKISSAWTSKITNDEILSLGYPTITPEMDMDAGIWLVSQKVKGRRKNNK